MSRFGWLLVPVVWLLGGCEEPRVDNDLAALLSAPGQGFVQARPGMAIELPEDMGPHRQFRLEWWYLTANLHTAEGDPVGLQWTLFRLGLRPRQGPEPEPGWHRDELWLAHAALSRPGRHRFADKRARGGSGQAGVTLDPFRAWIDQWRFETQTEDRYRLEVQAPEFAYRLGLSPRLPPVLHGEQGFSAKSMGGGGSLYFSYPSLAIEGEIDVDGETLSVSGQGWLDREWSSRYLQPGQAGWDWLALHLDDGRHLMLFRLRGDPDYLTGTLVGADGSALTLAAEAFSLQPLAYRQSEGRRVPVRWAFELPEQGISLEIDSWPGDYWNPGRLEYWEGPVSVRGSHGGEGYLEMTGYIEQ